MYRMLLVDDREIFLRTVRRMPFFEEHRDEIRIEWEMSSADKALSVLRAEHVDIVMTDIRMPMMSGIDLLKVIRKEKLCSCIILMSEYTDFAYAREGILYGAFDYIVKPIEKRMLETTMRRALACLQASDMAQDKEMITAEELTGVLFRGTEEELEREVHAIEIHVLSEEDPYERMHILWKLQRRLLQSLSREYSYLEAYIPLKDLLNPCETPLCTDADAALEHLHRSLLFLHRKAPLFHTESANEQVRNIWFYTIGNADGTCRLTDTAQRFFLNSSYLSSLFKKETGISYKTFVQDLKMERARYLLGCTDLKVSEIAARMHFSDTEYFRKTFKACAGMAPAKFDYQEYIDITIDACDVR